MNKGHKTQLSNSMDVTQAIDGVMTTESIFITKSSTNIKGFGEKLAQDMNDIQAFLKENLQESNTAKKNSQQAQPRKKGAVISEKKPVKKYEIRYNSRLCDGGFNKILGKTQD